MPRRESSKERLTTASMSAPLCATGCWRAAASEHPSEEIAQVPEVERARVEVRPAAGPALRATVGGAEGVVLLPLLDVGEDVICALDLLELRLGLVVAGIAVRVVLAARACGRPS